jgi:hypothetical protein
MIGHWLREKFPNIQFIIATHSPFIAQVADPESGVVIPDADSNLAARAPGNVLLKETPQGVIAGTECRRRPSAWPRTNFPVGLVRHVHRTLSAGRA